MENNKSHMEKNNTCGKVFNFFAQKIRLLVNQLVPHDGQRPVDHEIGTHHIRHVRYVAVDDAYDAGGASDQHAVQAKVIGAVARNGVFECRNHFTNATTGRTKNRQ